jgi:hypothetical protein
MSTTISESEVLAGMNSIRIAKFKSAGVNSNSFDSTATEEDSTAEIAERLSTTTTAMVTGKTAIVPAPVDFEAETMKASSATTTEDTPNVTVSIEHKRFIKQRMCSSDSDIVEVNVYVV